MAAWLILMKIRRCMQENATKYQIGRLNSIVQADESDIGGNPAYHFLRLYDFDLDQVSHRQENFEHSHLKDLNMIIGNFKNWIRGIHGHIDRKNTAYYLNEFAYRFGWSQAALAARPCSQDRRRTESNIFDRLVKRSITRHIPITYKKIVNDQQYLPMAA